MSITLMSQGYSSVAQDLNRKTEHLVNRYFQHSAVFGKQAAYSELSQVWNECSVSNWDGEAAIAVSEAAFVNTYLLIRALPLGTALPSVGVEPDGYLTLEWYRHPRWVLSLSIGSEPEIHYAALFGNSNTRGSLSKKLAHRARKSG